MTTTQTTEDRPDYVIHDDGHISFTDPSGTFVMAPKVTTPILPAPQFPTIGFDTSCIEPEIYIRVNVTKNTKGYNAETSVSCTGAISDAEMATTLANLLQIADQAARTEIARRTVLDSLEVESK